MLKKIFIVVSVLLFLSCPGKAAPEESARQAEASNQVHEKVEGVNSEEVDYVVESQTAVKMTQAEKAHQAETYDKFGGGITIIAMCIVISALAVLSILFLIFGRISSWFLKHKKKQAISTMTPGKDLDEDDHSVDSGEVIAAISAALAQHFSADHDMESTILTIHRMKKAYSPWNSKIYNMRNVPLVEHTHDKMGDR